MYRNNLTQVKNKRCGYWIEINEEYQDKDLQISINTDPFELDEVHIYCNRGIPSWYAKAKLGNMLWNYMGGCAKIWGNKRKRLEMVWSGRGR